MPKILVVDDDAHIRLLLQKQLELEGYRVLTAASGAQAIATAKADPPDLILLDLMLPDLDGLDVCRVIRQDLVVPIIMLTAKGTDTDKVVGLAVGADEYITKPFSLLELTARVKANLRRMDRMKRALVDTPQRLSAGNLVVDPEQHLVTYDNRPLELPHKEYLLLQLFMAQMNKAVSRETILTRVWGDDYYGDDRVVDVHVCRLREKLARLPECPVEIQTVRAVGYRLAPNRVNDVASS